MKKLDLEKILVQGGLSPNVFAYRKNKKPNQFRLTRSFFYRHGLTETDFERSICKALASQKVKFEVLDRGEHWHSFVGSAKSGSAQDSHWYVIVEIKEQE